MAPGIVKTSIAVVTARSVRMSIFVSRSPAIEGPMKKPACIEKVSHPIARPSRPGLTDSVIAENSAACCAPEPSPPAICQMNRGRTVVVAADASCEPPATISEKISSDRAPKRSMRRPDGSESGHREQSADLEAIRPEVVRIERDRQAASRQGGERSTGRHIDGKRPSRFEDAHHP